MLEAALLGEIPGLRVFLLFVSFHVVYGEQLLF